MKNENKNEKKLTFTGKIVMSTYTDRNNVKQSYPKLILDNPFDCEMDEMEYACLFRSDKGIFDFKSKQVLKTTDSISVTGYFCVESFYSKQTKSNQNCVGVYLNNPFFSGTVRLKNRSIEQKAVVSYLLSNLWDVKLSRYEDEKDAQVDVDADSN